jgi:hypothetical protein
MSHSRCFSLTFAFLLGALNHLGSSSAASERLAEINSKAIPVEVNHGAVTWVGVYFLADRFGDSLGAHFYPNMTKAIGSISRNSPSREFHGLIANSDHIQARARRFWPEAVAQS